MQQRQLRLGDILDDYCPRERRVTNHAIVAMIGPDVKQTRCTTCDAEHEYKHAKVPRQRRKTETPAALYAQVLAGGPKRIAHDAASRAEPADGRRRTASAIDEPRSADRRRPRKTGAGGQPDAEIAADRSKRCSNDEGRRRRTRRGSGAPAAHSRLAAAAEGQPPPPRPAPEFTIRQPGGRQNRFRPRHHAAGQQFQRQIDRAGTTGGGPSPAECRRRSGRPMASRSGR